MYIRLCVMSIHNHRKRNAEAQLRRSQNPAYRIQEQVNNMEQRQIARTNRENRAQEQVTNMDRRQIAHSNMEDRAQDQLADTARSQIAGTNPENRAQEQVANTAQRQNARTNPENRVQEQVANTAQRRLAREQPGVLENKALQRQEITYQISSALRGMECRMPTWVWVHSSIQFNKIYKKEMLHGWDCHPIVPILTKM
jgi:hypothetical protein